MLDSTYDIIGNSKKELKNRARLCSSKEILGSNVMSTFGATIKNYTRLGFLYRYCMFLHKMLEIKLKNNVHMWDFSIPISIRTSIY